MKPSIIAGGVILGVALVLVAVFRPSMQSQDEYAEENVAAVESAASEAAVAPSSRQEDVALEDWFPDLRDRGNIPGLDRGMTETRDSFGCDISELFEKAGSVFVGLTEGKQDPRLVFLTDTLSASADAELLLASLQIHAMLADGSSENRDAMEAAAFADIENAVRIDPTHPLVLWYASWLCDEEIELGFCGDSAVQANVGLVLGSNGAYWAREAEELYGRGDQPAALEALARAATAPAFDNYYIQNVRLLERALSLAPDIDYLERAIGAYAVTQDLMGPGHWTSSMCLMESESSPEWFDACLAYTQRSATESRTVNDRIRAAGLWESLHEMRGDVAEAGDARTLHEELVSAQMGVSDDLTAVLLTDERVMSQYLEEFDASDEISAIRFLQAEVDRLRLDPNYDPCPADDESDE